MILRFAAAMQDRYLRFRYRKYRAQLSRIACADAAVRAVRYRRRRKYVLAAVLAYMLIRKVTRDA